MLSWKEYILWDRWNRTSRPIAEVEYLTNQNSILSIFKNFIYFFQLELSDSKQLFKVVIEILKQGYTENQNTVCVHNPSASS